MKAYVKPAAVVIDMKVKDSVTAPFKPTDGKLFEVSGKRITYFVLDIKS